MLIYIQKAVKTMQKPRSKFCQLCGQPLFGSYLVYDNGLVVCQQCNSSVPHCSQCNMPSRQLRLVRGVQVCPACLQKAPVCPACHIPILGKYYLIGASTIPYCESCVLTRPHCDICRLPLDEHGRGLPEQAGTIYRCASCLRSAVTSQSGAERIYRETHVQLKRVLTLDVAVLPTLHIVERSTLVGLNQQTQSLSGSQRPIGPQDQHLLGFFQRVNTNQDIYIERLLPETLFRAVAAHELAHAWQSTNSPSSQPIQIVEGFAEWAAYHILLAQGQQSEAEHLTKRNDLYGQGLHYFINVEKSGGVLGVLQRAVQR
jgi:hypothetical protein